jgi:hypothetical protein
MPHDVAAPLEILSECACILGCPDTSTANMFSALLEMDDEIQAHSREILEHEVNDFDAAAHD